MSISEIKKMSVQERLTAMEQIWDSLCHEDSEPESPSWHGEVLAERKKLMDSPEAKYLTIEQLRERYR
ncbi:addiction module protein [Pelagicoccus sp. SDUM812003]|uniref:addiction module protein n=1 Tax=Pelagicoccus sp. SDUM812003 TaxID=3041267 RepID=UPI0031F2E2A6